MSESKGSRNVSLGPYRSTEIALEERLTKKELSNLAYNLERKDFGMVPVENGDIREAFSVLGYKEEKEGLHIRDDGKRFACLSGNDSFMFLISGDYNGNVEDILSDMDTIKNMESYKRQEHRRVCSVTYECTSVSILMTSFIGPINLAYFMGSGIASFFWGVGCLAVTGLTKLGIESANYNSKMAKIVSSLSRNARNYSYGKEAYDQIISECRAKAIDSHNPKELESSEIKQLPEKKEWAENQIGPETFVVSEAIIKYFEKPESERGIETAPEFKEPALLGKGRDKK